MNAFIFSLLPEEIQSEARDRLNTKTLQSIIEEVFDVESGKLFSRNRKREIVNGRQLYCSIIYHTTTKSHREISKIVGGTNHSISIHSCKMIALWLVYEKDFREKAIKVLYSYYKDKYSLMGEEFIKQAVSKTIISMIKNNRQLKEQDHEETPGEIDEEKAKHNLLVIQHN